LQSISALPSLQAGSIQSRACVGSVKLPLAECGLVTEPQVGQWSRDLISDPTHPSGCVPLSSAQPGYPCMPVLQQGPDLSNLVQRQT
jgi:hypothetical protein